MEFEFELSDLIVFENNEKNFETEDEEIGDLDEVLNFTNTEQEVINSCKNIKLKHLMILNRKKYNYLLYMKTKIWTMLKELHKNQLNLQLGLRKYINFPNTHKFEWRLLGAPYFKIPRTNRMAGPNQDVQRKQNELSVYDLSPSKIWSSQECDNLIGAIKCNFKINVERRQRESPKNPDFYKNLLDQDIPPRQSGDYIDWTRISTFYFQEKRTEHECKALWTMYLHPDINKSEWSAEENEQIKTLSIKHKHQNWDAIADELGTNRSAFLVCLHYWKITNHRIKCGKFDATEDDLLLKLINEQKSYDICWSTIALHFNDRSREQLYYRYKYFLAKKVIKGKFSDAEDVLLMILVDRFGRNFSKCMAYMPHRTVVQLRNRYNSNLQRDISKGSFTSETDQIIMNYVEEFGEKNWAGLARKLNRCRGQLRQRYLFIKTYLAKYPHVHVRDVPKRKHNALKKNEDHFSLLRMTANRFRNQEIPTLDKLEELLEDVTSIDDQIVDYFENSLNMIESSNKLLVKLDAKLEIPQNFEEIASLDRLDKILLKNYQIIESVDQTELIPPNLSTIKAFQENLRLYNSTKNNDQTFKTKTPAKIDGDQKKFHERLTQLFLWPAILSLENPNIPSAVDVNDMKRKCDNSNLVEKKLKM